MTVMEPDNPSALPAIDLAPWVPGTRWLRAAWWARERAGELLVAGVALLLNAWGLAQNDLGNPYYAAAARSMTTSWRNFVFASYDPGGWITNDKPPLAMWVQAVWVRVFGLNSWSMLLPSAIAGAVSVLLVISTVRRVWGRTAGLCAGVVLALTPAMFAVSRSSNPDAILVCCMVAAVWAAQRAIDASRAPVVGRRPAAWMTVTGTLIGLAFLAKMLVAMVVVPAIVAAYLVSGGLGWRRRLLHSGYLAGAFVLVSGAWIALMDLTSSSPWVGGSNDGSAVNLVFGYNGFGRVFGNSGPGGAPGSGRGPGGGLGQRGGGIDQFGGSSGIGRLFNNGMGDQVMWLSIIAAGGMIGTAVLLWCRRRERSTRRQLGSLVLFAVWAVTAYLLFAEADGVFHNYYVSALAPALAALVGIGVGALVTSGRTASAVGAALLAGTAVLQVALIRRIDTFGWLQVVVPVLVGVAALGLAVAALRSSTSVRARTLLSAAAVGAMSLAPAVWVWGGMHHPQNASFPDARPANSRLVSGGGVGNFPGTNGVGGGRGRPGSSTELLDYLEGQTTTERWILAVSSSMQANQAIIDGYSVMAMGGFNGNDAAMSVERLANLVERGELRFVSAGGGFDGGPGGGRGPGGGDGGGSRVSTVVTSVCAPLSEAVPNLAGADNVYDCRGTAAALRDAASRLPANIGVPPGDDANRDVPLDRLPGLRDDPPGQDGNRPGGGDFDPRALMQCLEEQGVDARAGRPDDSDPATRAALEACAQYLPDAGRGGFGDGDHGIGGPGGGPPPN